MRLNTSSSSAPISCACASTTIPSAPAPSPTLSSPSPDIPPLLACSCSWRSTAACTRSSCESHARREASALSRWRAACCSRRLASCRASGASMATLSLRLWASCTAASICWCLLRAPSSPPAEPSPDNSCSSSSSVRFSSLWRSATAALRASARPSRLDTCCGTEARLSQTACSLSLCSACCFSSCARASSSFNPCTVPVWSPSPSWAFTALMRSSKDCRSPCRDVKVWSCSRKLATSCSSTAMDATSTANAWASDCSPAS
mmetsp:Transcript_27993/g.75589  ORF Transcript_27993/g.75589 Transcript_27993/m.75589 type:complete len:261 (-) Transcript_27993:1718-2500(-)